MRALVLSLLVAACGDDRKPVTSGDASIDGEPIDANPQPLVPCLDRPGELARPPQGHLPCDLLPPGFAP